ncbi:MAG TPA: TonB-dependent receptor plug domain-containing protein, partial [Novosphingobium sp.]|nr:TonB-dependent receptor plug domain-containing protein [Novosphingobium sp.]
MLSTRNRWTVSAAALAIAAFAADITPAWAEEAASTAPDLKPQGDIVVTATRRSESANKIPLAIHAMGGDTLKSLNITSLDSLVENLGNVRSASRGPGMSSIYIRGLSTDTVSSQFAGTVGAFPNVALYLNDTPSSMPGRSLDIYPVDIQRVEVLAGPQGTLFGANAMGGAIRYITNKPDPSKWAANVTGSVSSTYNAASSQGVNGFINIPLVKDHLALRVTAYVDHQGGYISNVPGTYQMPFNGNVGVAGQLPTG